MRATERLLVGRRRGGDDPRTEQPPELDGGDADATGRAQDEQRLAGRDHRAIRESVEGGGVGEQRGGADLERDRVGQLHDGQLGERDALGVAAVEHRGRDAIADGELRDAAADGGDDARHLAARRERHGRLELVLAVRDEDVGEVDAAGLDVDQDLARRGDGLGDLVDLERGGTGERVDTNGAHGQLL